MKKADIIKALHNQAEIRESLLPHDNYKTTLWQNNIESPVYGYIDKKICNVSRITFINLLNENIIERIDRCNNYDVYMLKDGAN